MVVRVVATQGCAYRPLVTQRREHTVRREASTTATVIETAVLLSGIAIATAGIVQANRADTEAKEHPERCKGETSCSSVSGDLIGTFGVLVTLAAISILVVDSHRKSEAIEPLEDQQIAGASTEIHPCGTAAWQGSDIEARSSGPSGTLRTDERGEVRFAIPTGWHGPVEISVDGRSQVIFSL